ADDLRMAPGQTLKEKAKQLRCTCLTLRGWHLEWRGSGYDPHYVIRRGPSNTQPGRYKEKDWVAAVEEEIARGRARHIGDVDIDAGHRAADEAANEIRYRTRQRRRVERDTLLGIGGHEEILRRYRGNARLTDAHSRRIAKKLLQVSRWATMERALSEVGYAKKDIKRMMGELIGAFDRSKEEGQAQWKKTRAAVLRRRAEADAHAKAEQVEAEAVTSYTK